MLKSLIDKKGLKTIISFWYVFACVIKEQALVVLQIFLFVSPESQINKKNVVVWKGRGAYGVTRILDGLFYNWL